MAKGDTLPPWWADVKAVMGGIIFNNVPVPIWLSILWCESSGDASQRTYEPSVGFYSTGLFALLEKVGQGGSYTPEQLKDPKFNASVAKGRILSAYNMALVNRAAGMAVDFDVETGNIALDSGHPGRGTKEKPVTLADPRVRKIVRVAKAIRATEQAGKGDLELWRAAIAGESSPDVPVPPDGTINVPGDPGTPPVTVNPSDPLGVSGAMEKFFEVIKANRGAIVLVIVAIVLLLAGALGVARGG